MTIPVVTWWLASHHEPEHLVVTAFALGWWSWLVLHLGEVRVDASVERVAPAGDVIAWLRAERGRSRRLHWCDLWTHSTVAAPAVFRPARHRARRWWVDDAPAWSVSPPGQPVAAPDGETPASELPERAPYERRAAA